MTAFWKRYPNPFSTHVLTEDVVERKICGNQLLTKKLICKTSSFPKWADSFVGKFHEVYLIEESILDIKAKTLQTYTRNISLQNVMKTDEKCVYSASAGNQEATLCQREACFDSKICGFGGMIASYGLQKYIKNIIRTSNGYNYVLTSLFGSKTPDAKLKRSGKTDTSSNRKTKITGNYGSHAIQRPVLHAVQS